MPLITLAPYSLKKLYTAILMHLNGSSNASALEMANGYAIPNPYEPPHISVTSTKPKFGTKSLSLPGGFGEAMYTSATAPFTFPGDFTIELFLCANMPHNGTIFDIGGVAGLNWQSQSLQLTQAGLLRYNAYSNSSSGGSNANTTIAHSVLTTTPIVWGEWNHIAVVRAGDVYSVYLNGNREIMINSSLAPYTPSYQTIIAGYPTSSALGLSASQTINGHIDNWRVTKGVARYTGDSFVPPSTAFDSASDSYWANVSSFMNMETVTGDGVPVDSKSVTWQFVKRGLQTIGWSDKMSPTGTSFTVQLDKASAGFMVNERAVLNHGTDDFTWEFWTWSTTTTSTNKSWIGTRQHAFPTTSGISLGVNGSTPYVYADQFLIQAGTIPLNQWNHIALVRRDGVFTLYINGVSVGSFSSTVYNLTANRFGIGCNADGTANWLGSGTGTYISELRISTIARYNGNFTPPTAWFSPD